MNKICVIGLGYIGLPTAAVLATHGFQVIGVDTNPNIVGTINEGEVHIEEPGLRTVVQAARKSGNLVARGEPELADAFIICVPTPLTPEKRADLSYVVAAAEAIMPYLRPGNLVVLESTVPPGTTVEVVLPILERSGLRARADFYLAHCPERVLPGNILNELIHNDRVVGWLTPEAGERAKALYARFVEGNLYLTDVTTAEVVKLVENTFRDVNIALANELANICAALGVDVWEVIKLANRHPRVNLLHPGPGVGGHCIPIDPWFLVEKAPAEAKLIPLSREINDSQPKVVVKLVEEMVEDIADPKVTILGVAYKGNVGDIRESPGIVIMDMLKKRGYRLGIYDPHVRNFDDQLSGLEEAFKGSDCAVLVSDHDEFKHLAPEKLGTLMRTKRVLDTRCCLELERWEAAGFNVKLLGKGA